MADKTKVDYQAMTEISKKFQTNAEELNQLLSQTKNKVDALHNNQWQGEAADKFFNEMEGTVLPRFGKLISALGTASTTTQQISDTIKQADESTKSHFANIMSTILTAAPGGG